MQQKLAPLAQRDAGSGATCLGFVVLALASLVFYSATQSQRWCSDGAVFYWRHVQGDLFYNRHTLHPLAGWLVAQIVPSWDGELQMRVVSVVPMALAVAFSFLLAIEVGARRWVAFVAAALFAVSPAAWIAGTWIEVHALHAFAVVVATWAVLAFRERGTVATIAIALAGYVFAAATHASGVILGPAFVLWVGIAERRAGRRGSPALLLFVVGPVLLAGVVLGVVVQNALRLDEVTVVADESMAFVHHFQSNSRPMRTLVEEWLAPAGVLTVAVLAIPFVLRRAATSTRLFACGLLAFFLSSFAFFLWFGTAEWGGYALPSLALAVALAGLAFEATPPRALVRVVLVVTAVQVGWSVQRVGGWTSVYATDERRVQIVSALPDGGTLFSIIRPRTYTPELVGDGWPIREVRLRDAMRVAFRERLSPEEFAELAIGFIDAAVARGDVAIDLSLRHDGMLWRPNPPIYEAYVEQMLDGLARRYHTRRLEHPSWPMLVLLERCVREPIVAAR